MIKIEEKPESIATSTTTKETKTSTSSFMTGGFFEVTINAEKLSYMITHINELLFEQNKKIESLKQDFSSIVASIEHKVENESKKNGMLFSKLEMKIQESGNTFQVFLQDFGKRSELRDDELSKQVECLSSKIIKVEHQSKEDLKNGLKILKEEVFGTTDESEKQKVEVIEIMGNKVESSLPNTKEVGFKSLLENFTTKLEEVKSSLKPTFDGMFQKKFEESKISIQEEILSIPRRKDKFHTNFVQKDFFKEEVMTQRVVYPSNRKETPEKIESEKENSSTPSLEVHSRFGNKVRRISFTKLNTDLEFEDGYREIFDKVEILEKGLHDCLVAQTEYKNKEIIIDEKLAIIGRKLEKNAQEVAETKNSIRRIDNQKMDDKAIEDLRNLFKWTVKDLEESLSKKCSSEDLQKEKHRLIEKISIVHENIIEKADKSEIQKALFFLESKIKEIIFLIAAEQSDEREGAIMRVTAKCLSCDKEIEKQYQSKLSSKLEKDKEGHKKSEGQYIKNMTHRVRQRFKKEVFKNMTLGNESIEEIDSII